MPETIPSRVSQTPELIEADLYDDLLCRYERALVYAGELREKLRAQEYVQREVEQLKRDVGRLGHSVAVDEAYIRLLENVLEGLGVLSNDTVHKP